MKKEKNFFIHSGFIAAFAVLFIGGLLWAGLESSIVGSAVFERKACCTYETLNFGQGGYLQGLARTIDISCSGAEKLADCCARNAAFREDDPVRVIGAKDS